MALAISLPPSSPSNHLLPWSHPVTLLSSSPSFHAYNNAPPVGGVGVNSKYNSTFSSINPPLLSSSRHKLRNPKLFICRAAAEYKFPDPIPEFAEAETEKFRSHLISKLSKKKDLFGDSVEEVVSVCTEIFSTFLHTHYGGPGTLLVIPFIDMADTLNDKGLPGGPKAARAAVKWAQAHVDKDWKEWNSNATVSKKVSV
ncbi:hypothetical protein LguiA_032715 [Lonicera macranthoides]